MVSPIDPAEYDPEDDPDYDLIMWMEPHTDWKDLMWREIEESDWVGQICFD